MCKCCGLCLCLMVKVNGLIVTVRERDVWFWSDETDDAAAHASGGVSV